MRAGQNCLLENISKDLLGFQIHNIIQDNFIQANLSQASLNLYHPGEAYLCPNQKKWLTRPIFELEGSNLYHLKALRKRFLNPMRLISISQRSADRGPTKISGRNSKAESEIMAYLLIVVGEISQFKLFLDYLRTFSLNFLKSFFRILLILEKQKLLGGHHQNFSKSPKFEN